MMTTRNWVSITLLLLIAGSASASENARHEDILRVLAANGCSRGVCCLPRCGDGTLAAEIAKNGALLVLAIDEHAESVAAARRAALDTGLLGKRLFVDTGSPAKIPLSDDYADVVLIADLDDQALSSVSVQELERVLSPDLGCAIIGRAASTQSSGKLSRERLAAWASPAGDVQIREDADGLWAIFRKPRKKGADNWSYWNHGPDNNPASRDTAYTFPDSLQWLGRPVQTGRSVLFLSAGGRLFLAFSGDYQGGTSGWRRFGPDEAIEVHEHELHAFQAYNGQLLWSHPLPATPQPLYGYSVWIAETDKFYLAEGHRLVVLNAANGKELDRMRVCIDGQEVVWLAMDHGKLYVLTGSVNDAPEHSFHVFDTHIGKRIAAYDIASKSQIWEHTEPTAIDGHAIGLCQGKIYFFAGSRAGALSAADGKLLWANEKIDSPKDKPLDINPVLSHLICEPNAVSILNFSRGTIVLSPDDGHELWRHDRSGGFAMMFLGDRLLSNTMHKDNYCLDLLTGENPSGDTFGRSGCGRLISTPAYTIGQYGTVFDLESHKKVNREYQKPECDVGNVIANGMRYGAPHYCRCPHAFRGIMAWNGLVQPAGAPAHPLEVGQTAEPPAINSTTADWTQYRRDAQHTGSSPCSVGREPVKELWHYSASSPYLPTAPTAVNDIIFVGGSDGSIRGIDASNGHERWNCLSGGKIYFPPAFSDNRLFVGSSDGNLYCVGAANGNLQWRFRLAPQDQRMMVYDELISRWPVNVNPLIEKGMVFAAAGLIDCEGVSVFALDSHSGKVKWSNETLGNVTDKRIGVVPMGGMTIAGNRLWLRGDSGFPSAFDLETGALPDASKSHTKKGGSSSVEYGPASMGKDIGIFAGKYLIDGGRRLFSEQSDRVQYQLSAFAMELSPDGLPHGSRIALGGRGATMQIMPVWDDELFLTVVNEKLTAERATDLLQSFEAKKNENTVIKSPLLKKSAGVWTSDGHQINAMVLCRDAVLIAEGISKETNPGLSTQKTRFEEWRLTALDRETGRELWHVTLPSEPIYDGLAVDRNGRAIVSLSNGCVACYGH